MTANRSEIDYARSVHKTISDDIRQTTGVFSRRFLICALVPLAVLIVATIISGYVRVWTAASFQSDSLNLTTAISTSLVVIVVSWFVFRRLEQRLQGWAALRTLLGVLTNLTRLETALNDPQAELAALADAAWKAYREYTEVIGHPHPPLGTTQ